MKSGIYTIENLVNGKLYVGYSTEIKDRWRAHKTELQRNVHKNTYLQHAWNLYGKEMFKFEILVECEERFLKSEEHYWCNMLNVHNREYGYNIKRTNPSLELPYIQGIPWSEERKRALSIKCKQEGKTLSEDAREKARLVNKGRKEKPETKEKRLKTRKETAEKNGYWITPEQGQKIANALTGRKLTDEWRKNLCKPKNFTKEQRERYKQNIAKIHGHNKRAIVCLTIDGKWVKEYDSIVNAAAELGVRSSMIQQATTGECRCWREYRFIYKDDYNPSIDYSINKNQLQVIQKFTMEGVLIAEYKSSKEAGEANGVKGSRVIKVCMHYLDGRYCDKSIKGCIYKYKNYNRHESDKNK